MDDSPEQSLAVGAVGQAAEGLQPEGVGDAHREPIMVIWKSGEEIFGQFFYRNGDSSLFLDISHYFLA